MRLVRTVWMSRKNNLKAAILHWIYCQKQMDSLIAICWRVYFLIQIIYTVATHNSGALFAQSHFNVIVVVEKSIQFVSAAFFLWLEVLSSVEECVVTMLQPLALIWLMQYAWDNQRKNLGCLRQPNQRCLHVTFKKSLLVRVLLIMLYFILILKTEWVAHPKFSSFNLKLCPAK